MNHRLYPAAERFSAPRLRRMLNLFLAAPFVIASVIAGWYALFWRAELLLRFSHMLWVLGFWMAGTLALFTVLISTRRALSAIMALLAVAAIALAVVWMPLVRFASLFPTLASLHLPAWLGGLSVMVSWLMALRLRTTIAGPRHR